MSKRERDDPAAIELRPATDADSLYKDDHIVEIGRSHGSYRHVLSRAELEDLNRKLTEYLGLLAGEGQT
jgi:hypothetical protein